jgi:hypothetical protein
MTQGRALITALRRRPMTTMQILELRISVSPWKRIAESLAPNERLIKTKNARGLLVYRVTRV